MPMVRPVLSFEYAARHLGADGVQFCRSNSATSWCRWCVQYCRSNMQGDIVQNFHKYARLSNIILYKIYFNFKVLNRQ